ncbi:hypothetical protein [Dyella amyloliquefaciens]|uniref:hypothetical protein n=1 Tax=Dyella amyloliquefaciens TaxID=1770545 RepID=UPI00102EB8A0|nr:hypothetical protein [Dyella amyloliquefaciens]
MSILETLAKVGGAVAAVEATEKLEPNASILTKGLAAVAGFKGVEKLEDLAHGTEATPASDGNVAESN